MNLDRRKEDRPNGTAIVLMATLVVAGLSCGAFYYANNAIASIQERQQAEIQMIYDTSDCRAPVDQGEKLIITAIPDGFGGLKAHCERRINLGYGDGLGGTDSK